MLNELFIRLYWNRKLTTMEGDASDLTGAASGYQSEEIGDHSHNLQGRSDSQSSEGNDEVSDSSEAHEADKPEDINHITLIKGNYAQLVANLQPQLFIDLLPPYLRDIIEDDMRKKEKSRALLDVLMRSPREHYEQFCEVIAGLHPVIFEILKKRKPTNEELTCYLRPFCDKLREGILCTGSKTDNEVDPRIDLDTQFVSLKLIHINDNQEYPMQNQNSVHQTLEDNILQDYHNGNLKCSSDKDLDLKDILPDEPAGKNILITGRAGIGKSTLIQFLNRQWAKREWGISHTAVFLLNLRKLAHIQREVTLSQLLGMYAEYVPDPLDPSQPAVQWLENNQEHILLFTDGIDELGNLSRLFSDTPKLTTNMKGTPLEWCINIMGRNILHKSTLLMISRPFTGLRHLKYNKHIEVFGLVPERIMDFIELNVQKSRQTIVKETLLKNPVLFSICSITFYCAAISRVLERDERMNSETLTTFTRIVCFIISRLAARRVNKESDALVLSENLCKCLPLMAALAHRGICDSPEVTRLVFDETDFDSIGFLHKSLTEARETGLLLTKEVTDVLDEHKQPSLQAEFIHLSIQELFSAIYMMKMDIPKLPSQVKWFSGHLNMLQLFLYGIVFDKENRFVGAIRNAILGKESRSTEEQTSLVEAYLFREFEKHCLKGKQCGNILQLVQAAHESQMPNLAVILGSALAHDKRLGLRNLPLTAVDVKALFFTIQYAAIELLQLEHIPLDNPSMFEIRKYLSETSQLKELYLEGNDIADEGMKHLSDAIKATKSLNHLHISRNTITNKGMEFLSEGIMATTSLNHLELWNNEVTEEGMKHLYAGIKGTKCLSHLELLGNSISDTGMKELSQAVALNQSLQCLNLTDNKLSSEGMSRLSVALKDTTSITELELGYNQLSMESLKQLSKAIETTTSITHLKLSQNQINAAGIKHLSNAISAGTSLKHFVLSHNQLSDEGLKYLSDAIATTTSLIHLVLSQNQITNTGFMYLSEGIKATRSLGQLTLSQNSITTQAMISLSAAIKATTTLHNLELFRNELTEEGMKKLSIATRDSKSLCCLTISQNQVLQKGMQHLSQAISHPQCTLCRLNLCEVQITAAGMVVQGPRGVLWSPAANTECYIFLKTTDSLPSDSGHKTCQTCAVFMIIRHQLSLIPYIFG